jgi:hypothetical protein
MLIEIRPNVTLKDLKLPITLCRLLFVMMNNTYRRLSLSQVTFLILGTYVLIFSWLLMNTRNEFCNATQQDRKIEFRNRVSYDLLTYSIAIFL